MPKQPVKKPISAARSRPAATKQPTGTSTSLVCGILSIVLCWFPIIAQTLAIVGLVSNKSSRPEVKTGGLVTSVIGLGFSILYLMIWILVGIGIAVGA